MNNRIRTLVFAISLPLFVCAQRGHFKEEMESFRIAYLTKKLSLTPEEAKVFWPVYEAFSKEIAALRQERRKKFCDDEVDELGSMSAEHDDKNFDDKKALAYADEFIVFKEKELELIKKYHQQFKAVLPPQKVGLFCMAQEEFKKQLLKKMKHHDFEKNDWRRRE